MQYQSLNPGEIRLLTVYPSRYHKAFVRCHLSTHSLEGATYEALSYVWGTSVSTTKIYINEEEVTVTSNLLAALRHLRDAEKLRTLWVDALCINQSDQDEKSTQVMEMGNIFHTATTVCCWLGEEPAPIAMGIIKAMSGFHAEFSQQTDVLLQTNQNLNQDALSDGGFIFLQTFFSWLLNSVKELLERQYFHRVWTVQEMILGRRVIVYCGGESADWAGFIESFRLFLSLNAAENHTWVVALFLELHFFSASGSDTMQCDQRYKNSDTSLLDILLKYRNRDATDVRDKVYGLLSLCGQPGFKADYRKTTAQVYRDVLRYIIERDQNLDVLSAIGPFDDDWNTPEDWLPGARKRPDRSKQERQSWFSWARSIFKDSEDHTHKTRVLQDSEDHTHKTRVLQDSALRAGLPDSQQNHFAYSLPSWAVDWGAKGALYLFLDHVRSSSYNAGSSSKPQVKFSSSEFGRLEIDGIFIDTVVACSTCTTAERAQNARLLYLARLEPREKGTDVDVVSPAWNFWTSNKTGTDRYNGQENEETAFLRTITANQATSLVCKLFLQGNEDVASNTLLMAAAERIAQLDGEETMTISASAAQIICKFLYHSKFCVTRSGFMGRVPLGTREGDSIVVAAGGKVPLVLRPSQGQLEGPYTLVGDSYIHGIMDGEAFESAACAGRKLSTFEII